MITIDSSLVFPIQAIIAIIWVVLILWCAYKGFIVSLLNLIGTILAILLGWFLSPILAKRIEIIPSSTFGIFLQDLYTYINQIAWFIIIFLIVRIIIFIIEILSKKLHHVPGLKQVGAILGGLVGFIHGFLLICLFGIVLNTPFFSNGKEFLNDTWLKPVLEVGNFIYNDYILPIDTKEFTDSQKQIIEQWLDENGYKE